jgi:tetratricopeptide (TPR) repeat protein
MWLRGQLWVANSRGDYEAAEGYVRQWREEYVGGSHQRNTGWILGELAMTRGKLDQALSYFRDLMEDSEAAGSARDYQRAAWQIAYIHLLVSNDTARAQEILDDALVRYPLESVEPLDRLYVPFANAYARVGRPARAKAVLQELQGSIPQDLWWISEGGSRRARGWIAVAEGRLEDARAEFQRVEGKINRAFGLGQVYERMEQPDSAIANYQLFLSTPFAGTPWNGVPLVMERLGQLCEQQGELAKATEYYGRFVDLWAEADPDLQPRVEAARRALERLRAGQPDSVGTG